jgi:hypothetical protein
VQVVVAGAGFVLDGYDLMRTAALAADEVLAHAVS